MPGSDRVSGAAQHGHESERPAAQAHLLVFYEETDFLIDVVVEFLLTGRKSTERLLVVACELHRSLLLAALEHRGLDTSAALENGLLAMVDTDAMIEQASTSGHLEVDRLLAILNAVVLRSMGGVGRVRAYGELASLLVDRGYLDACRRLEAYWNHVVQHYRMALLCGYRGERSTRADATVVGQLCATHSVTLPSEHCSSVGRIESRLQHLFLLEQQVHLMGADLERARRVEASLRREVAGLNLCHATVGKLLRDFLACSQQDLAQLATAMLGRSTTAGQVLSHAMQHSAAIASVMRVLEHGSRSPAASP